MIKPMTLKWAATLTAAEALKTDHKELFEKALLNGAQLSQPITASGSTLWDLAVASKAVQCFEAMLPNIDLLSEPMKTKLKELHERAGQPNYGILAIAAIGSSPEIERMARLAHGEQERQRGAREALELTATAPSAPQASVAATRRSI